jgi:FG-GAP repeat
MNLLLFLACNDPATGPPKTEDSPIGHSAEDSADSDPSTHSDSEVPVESAPDSRDSDPVNGRVIAVDDADVKFVGYPWQGSWGISLASGEDVNDDGYPDVLIGVPTSSTFGTNAGVVYIFSGPSFGSGTVSFGIAQTTLAGTADDQAGYELDFMGDTNLDGMEDILVGAPGGGRADPDRPGQAHLFFSPIQGSMDMTQSDAVFTGEYTGSNYSYSYAGATVGGGDVNGDGVPDMLVGAPFYSSGLTYILQGPVAGELDVSDATTRMIDPHAVRFYSIFSPGDLDGDGLDNVAIVGEDTEVITLLYNDPPAGDIGSADADLLLPAVVYALPSPVDFNQDGYDDVWIVESGNDQEARDAGAAYVVLGPLSSQTDVARDAVATFFGTEAEAGFGAGAVLDLTGDEVLDAAISTGTSWIAGATYLFDGPLAGSRLTTEARVVIQGDGDDALRDPVAAGDLDGDGLGDLLLRSTKDDDGGEDAGAVWLFYGASLAG